MRMETQEHQDWRHPSSALPQRPPLIWQVCKVLQAPWTLWGLGYGLQSSGGCSGRQQVETDESVDTGSEARRGMPQDHHFRMSRPILKCRWPCWRGLRPSCHPSEMAGVTGRPPEMAGLFPACHIDVVLALRPASVGAGELLELDPRGKPGQTSANALRGKRRRVKGVGLEGLSWSLSELAFFHAYIHLILALSLRLQGICLECWTKMSIGHFGSRLDQTQNCENPPSLP